ncbi:MAG: hypothetical protein HYU41_24560 [Candidatus Rokubacteria bacterium]|nr:hypothetical protein [Candidatus Rokubacteria bacterium]
MLALTFTDKAAAEMEERVDQLVPYGYADVEISTFVKKLRLSSAVRPLAEYVADFRGDTVVLTEGNRAVAALIPLRNVDRESLTSSRHPEFLELIARSRAEFAAGRSISLGKMKRRVLPKRSPNERIQPPARRARRPL